MALYSLPVTYEVSCVQRYVCVRSHRTPCQSSRRTTVITFHGVAVKCAEIGYRAAAFSDLSVSVWLSHSMATMHGI